MMDTRQKCPAPAPRLDARAAATCLIGGIGHIVPTAATAGNVVLPYLPPVAAVLAGGAS